MQTYRVTAAMVFFVAACSSAHEPIPTADGGMGDGGALAPCAHTIEQAASMGFALDDCREAVECASCSGCAYFVGDGRLWQPLPEEQCVE